MSPTPPSHAPTPTHPGGAATRQGTSCPGPPHLHTPRRRGTLKRNSRPTAATQCKTVERALAAPDHTAKACHTTMHHHVARHHTRPRLTTPDHPATYRHPKVNPRPPRHCKSAQPPPNVSRKPQCPIRLRSLPVICNDTDVAAQSTCGLVALRQARVGEASCQLASPATRSQGGSNSRH